MGRCFVVKYEEHGVFCTEISILGVTKREHKLRMSQSLWKQNAPTIIDITLEAILSLFNRNLLMYSRHAKDMIKLVTDRKESLPTRMFHNTDRSDSLKGIWATEIRSVHGELKARSKNENLV